MSLGEIAAAAGSSLRPLLPFDAAATVTGVHVSELEDPGRYLEGGELLLTTGIPLHGHSAVDYVHRLAARDVGGIGIGLGEGWDSPPADLVTACRDVGVPLFAVPDGAPFLDVSRAFWSLAGRDGQHEARRTGHAHTRLVQAADGPDPVSAIVRLMAREIGGWAAWIPFGPGAPAGTLHPAALEGLLPTVRTDVERSLLRPGVAAASFASRGSTVVAFAVTDGGRTGLSRGAIALGAGRPLSSADRQLALTATALLRLATARQPRSVPDAWIAELAVRGQAAAARALAVTAGVDLPPLFRVFVGAAAGTPPLATERDGVTVALVPADLEVTTGAGVLSAPTILEDLPAAVARALALHRETPMTDGLRVEPESRSAVWSERLANADPELRRTAIAYLRNRHQAERTARELGVHRNTVRPRILAVERLLGVTLDDPDVAAELWIALRDRLAETDA